MANIKRIDGKTGVSFQITVTQGRDINGRQVRHYKTWKPEGRMTERQMQKAVERAAADFEREIEQGYQTDNRQTFSEYARYVIGLKRTAGAKEKTLNHYEYLLSRCDQAIGHLRLCDIRPQHLNLDPRPSCARNTTPASPSARRKSGQLCFQGSAGFDRLL